MKKLKILSLGLAALFGFGVISVATVTSLQPETVREAEAARETDSVSPETTLSATSKGRFSWNRKMAGTTTKAWSGHGAVYCSFGSNETFTVTWTVPEGYQVRYIHPFYNMLLTTNWEDTYKLKSTITCGDYSKTSEDTIAHYPTLDLAHDGKTPQHANVTFTIKNVSGQTGYLVFEIGENFEVEYEPMTATVTLDRQSGTGGTDNIKATYGSTMPSIAIPTKTGYSFDGYYDATSGGTKYYNANGSSARTWNKGVTSATLYARWTPLQLNVILNQQGGTGGTEFVQATYDQAMPSATMPTREGATFGGYFDQAKGQGKQYYSDSGTSVNTWDKASAATLYAYWIPCEEAQAVIDLIDNIGTVSYPGSNDDITAARNAYKSLSDTLKSIVDDYNYATLTAAEAQYEALKQAGANAVKDLINAIGEVSYPGSKDAIEGARAAYNTLTEEQKALVTNLATLEAAEAEYVVQRDAQIQAVVDEINALPEITTSNFVSDKPLVVSARDHYNALTEEQKGLFDADVLASLVAKEELIATYEGEKAAGLAVKDLINAIGEVSYPGSKDAIEGARAAYDALKNEHERSYVDNLDVLIAAEARYAELVEAKAEADAVMAKIEAIGEVSYPESGSKIEDAKASYNVLNDDGKSFVTNLATLEAAGAEYIAQRDAQIQAVVDEINALPEITTSNFISDKPLVVSARDHYNALTEEQKGLFDADVLASLVAKEELIALYEGEKAAGLAVKDLIDAIGEVSYPESGSKIDAARTAYDSLKNDHERSYVDNLAILEAAEDRYEELKQAGANAVKDLIDSIGNVEYSEESKDKIDAARAAYDALTEEQKELISKEELQVLVNAETEYSKIQKNANILVIILLIVVCLTILGGIWFLFFLLKKKRKDDDDDENKNNGKGKPVKAMSVGGFLPGVILISHYLDAPYIALYVLAGIAVLLWISILVVAIMKKKQVGPFKKKDVVVKAKPTQNEDEEETITVSDEKGNIFQIRYIKSFTAKLIQSPEETKKYYEELKNEVLSYKNTKSRISWHFDSINSGRNYVIKFAIRGKTLGVYYPLNADNYVDSKYKVEKIESKKYEDTPCLYRIKNDRRRDYAKELIAVVAANLGLEKGEEQHEVYSNLPYEPNKPLVSRGLIKEQKVQINKPSEVVLETKVDEEGDEIITTLDNKGNRYEIRYLKSFTAKLSQTDNVIKDYYNELKNYVLSYSNASSRVSWNYDSINVGKKPALKFVMKRKNLAIYYALDASKIGQKYKVEHVEYKKYEDVPCMYLIINEKRKELAKALVDRIMRQFKCEKGEELKDEYRVPFESKEALIKKGLIREVRTRK